MAKVYVGYLYQVKEGGKPVRTTYNYSRNFDAKAVEDLAYGMVLYKKIPFRKGVVREVITGKKIPLIAEGASYLPGAHTFIKFDGVLDKKEIVASNSDISMYAKAHQDPEAFKEQLEAIFKRGHHNVFEFKKESKSKKKADKKRNKESLEAFKDGSYAEKYSGDEFVEEEGKYLSDKAVQRSTTADTDGLGVSPVNGVPMAGATPIAGIPNGHRGPIMPPPMMMGGPMSMGGLAGAPGEQIGGMFGESGSNMKSASQIDDGKKASKKNTTSTSEKTNSDKKPKIIVDKSIEKSRESNADQEVESLESSKAEKVDAKETVSTSSVSLQNDNDNKPEMVNIPTTGKDINEVIRDLQKLAMNDVVACATIDGVTIDNETLKTATELLEYYQYKKFGINPVSPSVNAKVQIEKSMNLLNNERSI